MFYKKYLIEQLAKNSSFLLYYVKSWFIRRNIIYEQYELSWCEYNFDWNICEDIKHSKSEEGANDTTLND